MIKLHPVRDRDPILIDCLCAVWESSVRATHAFLTDEAIRKIAAYVPSALQRVPVLIAAVNEAGFPVGFMGIDRSRLEMLFIAPAERGKGLGGRLLRHAVENFGVNELCVNEQNPGARAFYEHLGFRTYRRTDTDEQGDPYPLLYMHRPG